MTVPKSSTSLVSAKQSKLINAARIIIAADDLQEHVRLIDSVLRMRGYNGHKSH